VWIPIIGALLGIVIGVFMQYDIPIAYVKYTSIAILAALDAIFGGIRAQLGQKFLFSKFITVVTFSIRLFQNLSLIREELLERLWRHNKDKPVG
jgi:small basic protein